jgi:signal transduction histidine kinase
VGIRDVATKALPRRGRRDTTAGDVVIATAVVVVAALTTVVNHRTDPAGIYRARDAEAMVLILVAAVPFYLRRRAPLPVFLVSATAVTLLMVRGHSSGALPLALFLGAYTVGAYRPAREVVVAAVFITAYMTVLQVADTPGFAMADLLSSELAFGTALVAGWTMQERVDRIDAFDREQAAAALRVAADERLRIAQELHDVVAHSLGVIAVQAGVGLHVIDTDPAEARRSFEHISRTSRASLAEIRGLLGVVRSGDGAASYRPAPGIGEVSRLADEVTGAGLPVDLRVDGDIGGVPTGVGLAGYRIVQEALTNALRHAGAHEARVRVDGRAGLLLIEVTDDGRGPAGDLVRGHGLIGMQERAALYGGSLDAGPGAGGGFRVTARLPYDTDHDPAHGAEPVP